MVSTEFHCAILTEETRIASKILFYQLSRQRQFSPIFCTQIPLEPARKLYRLGVLFTGEIIRCCAAPILKVTDISDTFLCHSLAQCKQAFIRYQIVIIIIIIIIIITLLISSKRLFSLIYNVKYLKLSFPKIPLKNAVLF